jgi:hypothetical protein
MRSNTLEDVRSKKKSHSIFKKTVGKISKNGRRELKNLNRFGSETFTTVMAAYQFDVNTITDSEDSMDEIKARGDDIKTKLRDFFAKKVVTNQCDDLNSDKTSDFLSDASYGYQE